MKDLRETWEPIRRSEWRPRNNREADRRDSQPSTRKPLPAE
jgi:hypothetical protein